MVVLERRATSEEAGAGISLWPNAMRILRDLDIGARDVGGQRRTSDAQAVRLEPRRSEVPLEGGKRHCRPVFRCRDLAGPLAAGIRV
jgi:2-polyprenyl-6-methoxyphenol hydroxylase-like FAD-dependent oxidoreductase